MSRVVKCDGCGTNSKEHERLTGIASTPISSVDYEGWMTLSIAVIGKVTFEGQNEPTFDQVRTDADLCPACAKTVTGLIKKVRTEEVIQADAYHERIAREWRWHLRMRPRMCNPGQPLTHIGGFDHDKSTSIA